MILGALFEKETQLSDRRLIAAPKAIALRALTFINSKDIE